MGKLHQGCFTYSSQWPYVLPPLYRWGNWGTEKSNNLPKIIQVQSGRAGIWTQSVWPLATSCLVIAITTVYLYLQCALHKSFYVTLISLCFYTEVNGFQEVRQYRLRHISNESTTLQLQTSAMERRRKLKGKWAALRTSPISATNRFCDPGQLMSLLEPRFPHP